MEKETTVIFWKNPDSLILKYIITIQIGREQANYYPTKFDFLRLIEELKLKPEPPDNNGNIYYL